MIKDDSIYLKHIMDAIERIGEYTSDMMYEEFSENHLVQDGVIRQIEIIGEAAKRLSEGTKDMDRSIPWKDVIGMRNKLIHDYFGVDIDAVWDTVEKDIPLLKAKMQPLLDRQG